MLRTVQARAQHAQPGPAAFVLRLSLGLAVRHEILLRNPMDHIARRRDVDVTGAPPTVRIAGTLADRKEPESVQFYGPSHPIACGWGVVTRWRAVG